MHRKLFAYLYLLLFATPAAMCVCAAVVHEVPFHAEPEAPSQIFCERTENGLYELSWSGSPQPDMRYLIFASNDKEDISTLIDETDKVHAIVDGRFCYYCIMAMLDGRLSAPSELFHLDEDETFDQMDEEETFEMSHPLAAALDHFSVSCGKHSRRSAAYVKSRYVDDQTWAAVSPYLLPINHSLKSKLDKIFNSGRVTATIDSLKKAGFVLNRQQGLHVVVARHPALKGVVVKVYLDYKSQEVEWKRWVCRVEAANAIRDAIKNHGYKSIFKVPRKWIYPLPDNSSPPASPGFFRKNFILIAEDMKLLNIEENKLKHRSEAMDRELMECIYLICEELGLADSLRIANLAWAKDGRLAFVDTEAYQRWPVKYQPFYEFLKRINRPIWQEITANARQE